MIRKKVLTAAKETKSMAKQNSLKIECPKCHAINRLSDRKILNLETSPKCKSCSSHLLKGFDQNLSNISANHYIHPLDRQALAALEKVPGVTSILKTLISQSFELATRLHHQANFVHVGPKQLSSLYQKLEFASQRLGVNEIPELYIYQDATANAYTSGVRKNFVAISTGCLELMTDQEILSVIAHELGHIHAEHVLYKTASRFLGSVASAVAQKTFGIGGLLVLPMQAALSRWDRVSELSADRAALLVVKNPKIMLSTLMKLSGGTLKHQDELNIDSFIDQAKRFSEMEDEGLLGKYITVFNTLFRSHPYTIWRAKEIINWALDGNFLELLKDQKPPTLKKPTTCPKCGKPLNKDSLVCLNCKPKSSKNGRVESSASKPIEDVKNWYKRNFTSPL